MSLNHNHTCRFDCKHQEMLLVPANINNFTKYGRSKGANLLKFHLFYCIFSTIMFHEHWRPRGRPKIAIYSFQKYSDFVRPSANSSNMEVPWQHMCIKKHCFIVFLKRMKSKAFGLHGWWFVVQIQRPRNCNKTNGILTIWYLWTFHI